MQEVIIKDEFIKLGQALKLAGLVESGVDAKIVVQEGLVHVNDSICTMRGKKLVDGDVVSYEGQTIVIKSETK
jgi:ribosome-associated protein